ncbi:head protein [Mycobacterium phage Barnyard]|uniref:Uncharacterized protein n=1 Tax=Mycobacterium phage Barnyard TaxID=205880 RepID=Q856D4_9CAUD|nr:head protein [Mycobacterium phage Barnyard]AAN02092.1 hypothetical protein PBI_BARNYARD_38 [Mycobacterium phage Barnyard]
MAASDAFKIEQARQAGLQGALVSIHSSAVNPASPNTNEVTGSGYARQTHVWGTPVIGSGGDAGKAVMTGNQKQFVIPAGQTASHYAVRKADGTYLWSDALDSSLTVNSGSATINVTPVYKYTHP